MIERYEEKRATNKGYLFVQLARKYYEERPLEQPPTQTPEILDWIHGLSASLDEWELCDWISRADDYLKAFFTRELEAAYDWTHGGKERFEAACKETEESFYTDKDGEIVLGAK